MAVREFDGIDDELAVAGSVLGSFFNGAFSGVLIVKPLTDPSNPSDLNEGYWGAMAGGTLLGSLHGHNASNFGGIRWFTATEDSSQTAGMIDNGEWQIIGFSKAAATEVIRFHTKPLVGGSWQHLDGGGDAVAAKASAITAMYFSAPLGGDKPRDMRLAAAALYTTELSDANFESIFTTPSTQTLLDLGAVATWEFNQPSIALEVIDIVGGDAGANQTAITGTTVVTDDDPPGWTFGPSVLSFPIASANDDGSGYMHDNIWPPETGTGGVWVDDTTGQVYAARGEGGGEYYNNNAFFRWDTSLIPDEATITIAYLSVTVNNRNSIDDYVVVADYYDFGGEPTVAADYIPNISSSIWTPYDLSQPGGGVRFDFQLGDLTGINKSGYTGIRMGLADRGNTVPGAGNDNSLKMEAFEGNPSPARLLVVYTEGVETFPTTGLLDDFTRANEDPATTNWSYPVRPTFGAAKVVSNQFAQSSIEAYTYYDLSTFGPDSEVYATLATLPGSGESVSLAARISDGPNTSSVDFYQGSYTVGTGWWVFRVLNNAYSQLGSTVSSPTMSAGDSIGLEVTTVEGVVVIRLLHKTGGVWSQIISEEDDGGLVILPAGYLGVEFSDTTARLDDFSGGTFSELTPLMWLGTN